MTAKQRIHGIAGMTDHLRPVVAGKAKIGEKTTNASGKEFPTKIDYIKFVDGSGNKINAVHDVLGERPVEFVAVFPSNDPNEFWWPSYRRWSAAGLLCHGDGREAVNETSGEQITCPCKYAEGYDKGGSYHKDEDRPECKPAGSLKVIIPDLPSIGVFQIDTRAVSSIANIQWAIHAVGSLTGGAYMGVPVKVRVEPFKGKKGISYCWKLDILGTPSQVVLAAAKQAQSHVAQLIPAELLQIDESRPIPEALPEAGEMPAVEVQSEDVSLADLKRLIGERAKVLGWTPGKAKSEFQAAITRAAGDKVVAAEDLLDNIEDMIADMEEVHEG